MKGKACVFRILLAATRNKVNFCSYYRNINPYSKADFYSTTTKSVTRLSPHFGESLTEANEVTAVAEAPKSAAEVFKKFGFDESHVSMVFSRQPSLRNATASNLESKLILLRKLGITSSQLVSMIYRRPRFLSCRLNQYFEHRLDHLVSLFECRELVIKAIVRNPSLLIYDFNKEVKPVFALYERLGISKKDFIAMLMVRPTMIPRTNLTPEKLDYIRRTRVTSGSKMYKYVVSIMAVSRFVTISEKVANFEKFGFSEDEVLQIFGQSPVMMTLSVEKVQRNMTFIIGTMKLPAEIIRTYPFMVFCNLEAVLKPRVFLAGKLRDMDLYPQIDESIIFRALRMSEKRFLKVFVNCHEKEVRDELLMHYEAFKGTKRLAASSKKLSHTAGFPF